MPLSPREAWKRILDEARRELPEQAVTTWLQPAEPLVLENDRLVLGLPDEFAVQWNQAKHANLLSRLAEQVFGRRVDVAFRVPEDRITRPQIDFFTVPPPENFQPPMMVSSNLLAPLANLRPLPTGIS